MELQTWLIYTLAATGLSLSPGPNGLLALTNGALHGRHQALYTRVGRRFNQACGGVFVAIGAALPLRS